MSHSNQRTNRRKSAQAEVACADLAPKGAIQIGAASHSEAQISALNRRKSAHIIPVATIQHTIANYFGLSVMLLLSDSHVRQISRPRQIAMFLARRLTSRTYPELGRLFGARHHTTVMHGCRRVRDLMARDPRFAAEVEVLARELAL